MKITEIKIVRITANFDWVFVRVCTDKEIDGFGEIQISMGAQDIVQKLKLALLGEDPRNVERLYQKMYRAMSALGGLHKGVVSGAISGVEFALWDITGKALGVPVYQLLGGKFRDKIRVYADSDLGSHATKEYDVEKLGSIPTERNCASKEPIVYSPESYAKRATEVKAKGFTALKFDLDLLTPYLSYDDYNRCLSNPEIRYMISVVEAVRKAVGDDTDLALDCHWRYSVKDAIKIATALEDYNLLWLEDPVPPDNIEAMKKVSRSTKTPICTGENLFSKYEFRELIEKQAVAIVSPDMDKVGGLLETKKIADMADCYYIPVAPHNLSSPIGTIAAVHACAAMPNFLLLEFHAQDVDWWNDLVRTSEPIIKDGYIQVPEKPGLGIELNKELIIEHMSGRDGKDFFI